jgi:hypothetical protein
VFSVNATLLPRHLVTVVRGGRPVSMLNVTAPLLPGTQYALAWQSGFVVAASADGAPIRERLSIEHQALAPLKFAHSAARQPPVLPFATAPDRLLVRRFVPEPHARAWASRAGHMDCVLQVSSNQVRLHAASSCFAATQSPCVVELVRWLQLGRWW